VSDFGFKISSDGYDVKTATNSQLVYSSTNQLVKLLYTGTVVVSIAAADTSGTTTINFPYYPSSTPLTSRTARVAGLATVVLNGKRYRSNVTYYFVGATSPTDFHACTLHSQHVADTGSQVLFNVSRTASATTAGTNESFTLRYYIVEVD
jgi:hypothetical protein